MPTPSFADSPRFQAALRAFDEANAQDPNLDPVEGTEIPRELLYARRLTEWVLRLAPNASEALQLAARGQHVGRWEIPRTRYPADRAGYLRWKRDLQHHHARRSGEILAQAGYDPDTIRTVQALNLKQGLGRDPDCQTLEDALCLVFLQYQASDLATRTDEGKFINAVRKSWTKMSEAGRAAALALPLEEGQARIWILQALRPDASDGAPAGGTPDTTFDNPASPAT